MAIISWSSTLFCCNCRCCGRSVAITFQAESDSSLPVNVITDSLSCRFTTSPATVKCSLIASEGRGQWLWQRHLNIWPACSRDTRILFTFPSLSLHVSDQLHCLYDQMSASSVSFSASPLRRLLSFAWHPCQTMPSKESESVLTGFRAAVKSSSRPVSHGRDSLYFSRL